MFKHILVPLDGSEVAEVALPIVQPLAQELRAKVTLVRVVDIGAVSRSVVPAASDAGGFTQEMQDIINESEVVTEGREGAPGDELLAAVEADGVDAAAIATHGRSGITRTIFGSVADQLIRESGKPIIVIKAKRE